LASFSAAVFLIWTRDDENADDVDDDDEEDDDNNDDDGTGDRDQQQQQKVTRRRRQRRRRRRRRTLLTTRTSRRRWTAAVRTTIVVTAILRLILSVGPEPTLWLLGAITVRPCPHYISSYPETSPTSHKYIDFIKTLIYIKKKNHIAWN